MKNSLSETHTSSIAFSQDNILFFQQQYINILKKLFKNTLSNLNIHTHMYIYMCVCVYIYNAAFTVLG